MDISSSLLISYLRTEADLSEEKARRLRAQARALELEYGPLPADYEMSQGELPPLDEHGVPKYRGRKRGRKAKPRKRHHDPSRPKRKHTAYTLFVQETYPTVKAQCGDGVQSKDLISLVARQWAAVPEEEKEVWKQRAVASAVVAEADEQMVNDDEESEEGEGEEEEEEEAEEEQDDDDDDDEGPRKRRGRKF